MMMRLQKYLSAAGVCSRRKGEALIQEGRISVNGVVVSELGTKVDPDLDMVEADGKVIYLRQKLIYIALNKPRDYVTSCNQKGEKTVLDLVDVPERVYPVGRLDKDSTGLLLLTNDGSLHHRLSHPSFDHEKEYIVTLCPRPHGQGVADDGNQDPRSTCQTDFRQAIPNRASRRQKQTNTTYGSQSGQPGYRSETHPDCKRQTRSTSFGSLAPSYQNRAEAFTQGGLD